MSSTAAAESFGVRLKRKVRSAETKLFEWRPCSCTIVAREGKLLLQLQTPPRDEDSQEEYDSETETVTIDLASQLLNVVPKKNKARCDLEYYAPVATMSGEVVKEELMAPSAAHCQQWMAQVRRVQQQAHQQRRPASSTSTRSGASPVAPLPSPLTSHAELTGSRASTTNDATIASSVQLTAVREPSPLRGKLSREMSGSELAQPEAAPSSSVRQSPPSQRSGSSSLSSSAISSTRPENLAVVATAVSCRFRERCDGDRTGISYSELDHTVDSSSCSPTPVFEPAARSDTRASIISSISSVSTTVSPTSNWRRGSAARISSPQYSSSSENDMPHSPHRRSRRSRPSPLNVREFQAGENNDFGSDDENEPTRYRRRSLQRSSGVSEVRHTTTSRGVSGVKLASSSLSSRVSPSYRVSARTQQSPGWYNDLPHNSTAYDAEDESSQAELHILHRVEAALRALELENAQAKARERKLVQEIQTLRDAARVTAAERKHIEQEYRHARKEIDSWRRAAQSAEAAATQLQEQLGIAREENQLFAGEKLRLKRQNNELLTQVHRLDSLVYGRF
ncbi:hypothetical protein PHYPSEUDO_005950 [Phytophthora pseudosyringae]|uniref:PH domain-containing protein n=1 Tax=Phytophthora pseudosyringae TaxID=221518 RepID=A0A8T1VJZ4_9STRA|nr:hypothetical protein PHYPSEUDO_005950 [Phytophthora pseudosyringae]